MVVAKGRSGGDDGADGAPKAVVKAREKTQKSSKLASNWVEKAREVEMGVVLGIRQMKPDHLPREKTKAVTTHWTTLYGLQAAWVHPAIQPEI